MRGSDIGGETGQESKGAPQMSPALARFDDRWGLTWRAINALRRFDLRWTSRFCRAWLEGEAIRDPIFIVGAPRSGTTLLFHLLRESRTLGSLPGEGHNVWRTFHHPRCQGWSSDHVGAGQIRRGERRFVAAYFRAWIGHLRLVEKTPENSIRIPYLHELFPDARFVAIHRNPLEVIHSLITGWRHPEGRFRSYYLPEDLEIPEYPYRRRWCFALVDGWRGLRSQTIPEIALAQWTQCVEGLLAARRMVSEGRWLDIRLEELLARPRSVVESLVTFLEVPDIEVIEGALENLLSAPVNAGSPPAKEKWRRLEAEITPLLTRIEPLARELGYEWVRAS